MWGREELIKTHGMTNSTICTWIRHRTLMRVSEINRRKKSLLIRKFSHERSAATPMTWRKRTAAERGHSGRAKVSRWWLVAGVTPVTAHAHALCTHWVLRAVRQVWLRLDLSRDWSLRFRWSSREVSGIIGKMSDRHKTGWWNIIRKPFVIRGEPGSPRGVVSLKWSHPSPQLHIWLGHE